MTCAGVILCGGASERMGRDKALLDWGGASAVQRLAQLCRGLGLAPVITAGADHGLPFVLDARRGPCGGVLAAAVSLRGQGVQRMLVLAVDAPTILAEDLRPLLAAASPGACYRGLPLPMVIELAALPDDAQPGWPLRRLAEAAGLLVLDADEAARPRLRGANTPAEHAILSLQLD